MKSFEFIKANRKNRKTRSGRRGARYWVVATGAFGAIVAFTAANSHAMTVARAAERNGVLEVVSRDVDFKSVEFDIPSGTIQSVIDLFRKKTGIEITVENESILAIASPGVSGKFTIEQALKRMLEGTGVMYIFRDARHVVLSVQAEAASVEITDTAAARAVSSPKYTAGLRDTPQTINVIPEAMIEQQGATTLRDVLNNVPGITLTAGEGGAPAGDNLTIRGFSARNDIYVDGVRDLGAQSRDPFNLEQVEIVKGPSSSFTGRGSTGGTINLVSKLPTLRRAVSGTVSLGTSALKRGTLDVNIPFNKDVAFRLNAMGHDSDFPGREVVQNRRWGIAPSVMFGLSGPTRLAVSYFHLGQENTSDYGIPWVPAANNVLAAFRDRPAPVPRETFYGFLERDKEKLRSDLVTVRFEHDFNDNLSLRNQFRYGYSSRDSMATPPRFANNNSTTINREMRSWIADDDIFDNQLDLTARFRTGSIEHSTVFGGSFAYEKNRRVLRTAPNSPTTLLGPNPNDIYTGVITVNPLEPSLNAKSLAGYAFDTVRFNRFFQFVGGVRWDRFDVSGRNVNTGVTPNLFVPIERVDNIVSGRSALIFKPIETGTIYASYGTSANPSFEGLLYSPADVRTPPEKTRTMEAGTKWELFDSRLLLNGALFQVDKIDARTPSLVPGEPPTLDGDQRVRGIEFSATGNFTRNWQVFAGYTFLDSEIVRSNTLPTNVNGTLIGEVGKELINTPRNSFNLWTTYRWDRLFFGGGPRFVGQRFGNNINTRVVDAYWVTDAMMSFRVNRHIDLRLNVNNIADKYYIDRIGGGHIIPGAGRVVMVSSGFSF